MPVVRLWSLTCSWVNKTTADACQDYNYGQQALNSPPSRAVTRFIITLLMINFALAAFFVFSFTSYPNSRTVRHWGDHYILKANTSHFGSDHLFCPCNKSASKWPVYVRFHWAFRVPGHDQILNRSAIGMNPQLLCDALQAGNQTTGIWIKGCYEMAISFMKDAPGTTVETPSLLGPSSVARLIIPAMQNNINNVFSNYQYLLTTNKFEDWIMLVKMKQMFNKVGDLFLNSSSAPIVGDANMTDFLYWEAFNSDFTLDIPTGTVKALQLTGNRALSMEMNWTAYMLGCGPVYCDAVVRNSNSRRFFWAVTEVGGFSAVVLVLLRYVVWPLLRGLCGWEASSAQNVPHASANGTAPISITHGQQDDERRIAEVRLYPLGQPLSV